MAAGDFSCAALQKVNVAIDRIWLDNQTKQDYVAYSDTIKAVLQEQTASFPDLKDPLKDKTVKVYWVADCDSDIIDCDDECSVGGETPEASCKEYALDICRKVGFTVPEKEFRTSNLSREEVVARAMLRRLKTLDEDLSKKAVAKLNIFAGKNQWTGGIGQVEGASGDTYLKPAYWTADLFGYLSQAGQMNKFQNPFLLNGTNLYQQQWMAQFNNANANEKDQALKMGSIRSYWDLFNIDSENNPDKISYMIDRGAVAFVSKVYNPASPVEYSGAGLTKYSIPSRSIPGVFYDVVYTNRCENDEIYHDWSISYNAGIFQNPLGCNADVTGILRFLCGEAAGS